MLWKKEVPGGHHGRGPERKQSEERFMQARGPQAIRMLVTGAGVFFLIAFCQYGLLLWLPHGWEAEAYGLVKKSLLDYILLALLGFTIVAAILHFIIHGAKDMRPRGAGDRIAWWSMSERLLHWALAAATFLLVVTGVYLYFAGGGLPDATTRLMRRLHFNELFAIVGFILFLAWFREALPRRYDRRWLRHLGGHLGFNGHLKAGKFNAGQKIWFWLCAFSGILMVLTGHQMQYNYGRLDPEYYPFFALHLIAAVVFLPALALHVYLAVLAVRGALQGMIRGWIGRRGALELHSEATPRRNGRA
jgi:formate dehydrogenase subunit gamma